MIRFFQGIKRAADFFSIHPDGLSFVTERRLKDLEASVSKLPKAISDRNFTSIMNLEYDIYELKETIKTLQSTLDKEQVPSVSKVKPVKTTRKPKALKLQKVEEEVEKVKSTLTQREVKRLFTYRDGELYWKVDAGIGGRIKKGTKIGTTSGYKAVSINNQSYTAGRIIFLMFHGYIPERVCFIDRNPQNTRIENLRAATISQMKCGSKKRKDNNSGYKGVYFHCKTNKYIAQIQKHQKRYNLGYFDSPKEAYKAYCKAAKKLHGEFARVA